MAGWDCGRVSTEPSSYSWISLKMPCILLGTGISTPDLAPSGGVPVSSSPRFRSSRVRIAPSPYPPTPSQFFALPSGPDRTKLPLPSSVSQEVTCPHRKNTPFPAVSRRVPVSFLNRCWAWAHKAITSRPGGSEDRNAPCRLLKPPWGSTVQLSPPPSLPAPALPGLLECYTAFVSPARSDVRRVIS